MAIRLDADQAVRELRSVARESHDMGEEIEESARRGRRGMDSLGEGIRTTADALQITDRVLEAFKRSFEVTLDQLREGSEGFQRLEATIMGGIHNAMGVLDDDFDALAARVADSDDQLGKFTRNAIAHFADFTTFGIQAALTVAAAFVSMGAELESTLLDLERRFGEIQEASTRSGNPITGTIREIIGGVQGSDPGPVRDADNLESQLFELDRLTGMREAEAGRLSGPAGSVNAVAVEALDREIAETRANIERLNAIASEQGLRNSALADASARVEETTTETISAILEMIEMTGSLRDQFVAALNQDFSLAGGEGGAGAEAVTGGFLGSLSARNIAGAGRQINALRERVDPFGRGSAVPRDGAFFGDLSTGAVAGATVQVAGLTSRLDPFGRGESTRPNIDLGDPFAEQGQRLLAGSGRLISSLVAQWENLGDALGNVLGRQLSSFGDAFTQGAASIALGAATGPLELFAGFGLLFSVVGGLLSGGGSAPGVGATATVTATQDLLQPRGAAFGQNTGQTVIHQSFGQVLTRAESVEAWAQLGDDAAKLGLWRAGRG